MSKADAVPRQARALPVAGRLTPSLAQLWVLALLVGVAGCGDSEPGDDGVAPRGRYADANLIVISLDTLRADALGTLGGPKGISPVLDQFAAESVLFTAARSQAPHTAPSHMSLFTSTYPSVHGVQNVVFGEKNGKRGPIFQPVAADRPLLAEVLSAAGFATVGLTDGGNLNPPHGFKRGFDEYTRDLTGVVGQVDEGLRWMTDLSAGAERWFLFWHTYEIHAPYAPPQKFIDRWAPPRDKYEGPLRELVDGLQGLSFSEKFGRLKPFWKERDSFGWPEAAFLHGLYKGGVRYTDVEVDRLFESMRSQGVFERAIVVLLSDHGEEFYEHGKWQHEQLFEECLRVPLMIHFPDGHGAGRRIDEPVALIDVMPTLLDLLDLEPGLLDLPGELVLQGISHAEALLEGGPVVTRPIVSELRSDIPEGDNYEWMVAIHDGDRKFVHDMYRAQRSGPNGEVRYDRFFYDLRDDPRETKQLWDHDRPPALAEGMVALFEAWRAETELLASGGVTVGGGGTLEERIDRARGLEQLGYVEDAVFALLQPHFADIPLPEATAEIRSLQQAGKLEEDEARRLLEALDG